MLLNIMSQSTIICKTQLESLNEKCIIVDHQDNILGTKSKKECHLVKNGLPLHRAFSVLLFNQYNELLLTRRSSHKITFPDYITNSCCSHPLYSSVEKENEIGVKYAAQRRLGTELGISEIEIPIAKMKYMTRFIYKDISDCGLWGEHELDYIIIVKLDKSTNIYPNSNEVKSLYYTSKSNVVDFLYQAEARGVRVSAWFKLIIDKLLLTYWDNIHHIELLQDHKTIHNFNT